MKNRKFKSRTTLLFILFLITLLDPIINVQTQTPIITDPSVTIPTGTVPPLSIVRGEYDNWTDTFTTGLYWNVSTGDWRVEGGRLKSFGLSYSKLNHLSSSAAGWWNFEVQYWGYGSIGIFFMAEGVEDAGWGDDARRGYGIVIDGSAIRFVRRDDGGNNLLQRYNVSLPSYIWLPFEVLRTETGVFTIECNSTIIMALVDTTYVASNYFVLEVNGYFAQFDNIVVQGTYSPPNPFTSPIIPSPWLTFFSTILVLAVVIAYRRKYKR